jgi:mRNA interferase YafQ
MRTIEGTGKFKRDYKREMKGMYRATLESDFIEVLKALVADQALADRHRDHALTGDLERPSGLPHQTRPGIDLQEAR